MSDADDWYVLVERTQSEERVLMPPIHVPEGRAAAIEIAREFCRTKGVRAREDGKNSGRQIYRTGETSWLVAVQTPYVSLDGKTIFHSDNHLRVEVARLEAVVEEDPMEIPKKKGLFGRG
ncbi:hypothetical protein Afil01_65720 [Actinorhabdospora filicis]|uniref:Uncharacterized protein n=1 Tax=Actinorhabdospora filicis TaxID=1785913 RepID=A0A9W6STP6_9ACTN|nr:hypothetical protein [Actinorhabdospora filicis]GLZ81765.1 hypothetical protein Afil01_65720 [Actinorhabdospora filicis]